MQFEIVDIFQVESPGLGFGYNDPIQFAIHLVSLKLFDSKLNVAFTIMLSMVTLRSKNDNDKLWRASAITIMGLLAVSFGVIL